MNEVLAYFGLQGVSSTVIQVMTVIVWLVVIATAVFLNRKKAFVNRFDFAYYGGFAFLTLAMFADLVHPFVYMACVCVTLVAGIVLALRYANKRHAESLKPSKVSFSVVRHPKHGKDIYIATVSK